MDDIANFLNIGYDFRIKISIDINFKTVILVSYLDCGAIMFIYNIRILWVTISLLMMSGSTASADQVYGSLGSPSATQSINGQLLPPAEPPFGGIINLNASESKPWWPPRIVPPKGAPNILLIITDDVGFGAPSTFGGVIPTPALDRIANEGLRYTQFHSTALCSPTRAALITGRNHHSVGFGVVS